MEIYYLFMLLTMQWMKYVSGNCFFPVEYQGIFATQSTLTQGNRHQYSEITILPDAIPIWGVCHKRTGNTVILYDGTGGQACMRCFHFYLRSPNVIQVYTEGLDRCYSNEEAATNSCPSMQDIRSSRAREIMLYKSRSFNQDGRISRVMCPFVGRYHFSYGAFDGKRQSDMCLDLSSHLTSCPRASQLQLSFRDCTFGNLDLKLECLGSWIGFDDNTYLAMYDPHVTSDTQPSYRCAMYHTSASGRVSMSLSVDSSCHKQLVSPWQGFESMSLTPFKTPSPPSAVYAGTCKFPDWMQGQWQDVSITNDKFIFRDETTDQLHTATCISEELPAGERFALYSVNQCGEESFTCVWIKSRSSNVMEFVRATGADRLNATSLCSDDQFWKHAWLTQGRKIRKNANCPISGEFVGVLPDDSSLCARLTSDCTRPHQMHYTVFPCQNDTVPYEDTVDPIDFDNFNSLPQFLNRKATNALLLSRNKRSPLPTWSYSGATEKHNRYVILSSRPSSPVVDLPKTIYVYENNLDSNSLLGKNSASPRTGRFNEHRSFGPSNNTGDSIAVTSEGLPITKKLTSNPSRTFSLTVGEPAFPIAIEDRRIKRNDFEVSPGEEKERFYQCLGQWEEAGVTYTYTWRRDVHKHECFAGVVVSGDEVFITEAGTTCRRGMQPLKNGMKIIKRNTCSELEAKRNYMREIESNDIINSIDNKFGSRGRSRWNRAENQQLLTSGGRKLKIATYSLLLGILITVIL